MKTNNKVSEQLISSMVNRFLGWKLPQGFCPDCYIDFDKKRAIENKGWPVGTNLLTAEQAKEMFEYCLGEENAQSRP